MEINKSFFIIQTEIAKRLNTILLQITPFLTQEVKHYCIDAKFVETVRFFVYSNKDKWRRPSNELNN